MSRETKTLMSQSPKQTSKDMKDGKSLKEEQWHNYYPQPPARKSIVELLSMQDKDNHAENRTLVNLLEKILKNPTCRNDIGLKRAKKCHCKVKNPCSGVTAEHVHRLLDDDMCNGYCRNCGIVLSLWDETTKDKINCFQLYKFDTTGCISEEDVNNGKVRVFCLGCRHLAQICHSDVQVFSHWSQIIFRKYEKMTADKGGVDAWYFPRIDFIDEYHRSIKVVLAKKFGGKVALCTKWLQQEGFATYGLTHKLQIEMEQFELTSPEYKKRLHEEKNEHVRQSSYFDPLDENILEKKIKLPKNKKKKDSDKEEKQLPPASTVVRNVADEDLYRNKSNYVIFKVPIDPRRSVQKTNLSAIEAIPVTPQIPLSTTNYLLTTYCLATLQKRFDYEEFLRWGLDVFRRVTPKFKNSGDIKSNAKTTGLHTELKKIQQIGELSQKINQLQDELASYKKDEKEMEKTKKELIESIRAKCLNCIETGDIAGLNFLRDNNILITFSSGVSKKGTKKTVAMEYVAAKLPFLLKEYNITDAMDNDKLLQDKCNKIALALCEQPEKTRTLTLKYIDPEKDEKAKEARNLSRAKYNEKKRKEKEEKATMEKTDKKMRIDL